MSKTVRHRIVILGVLILLLITINLPPVNNRLLWRIDELRVQIMYIFNPPDEAIFQPGQPVETPTEASELLQNPGILHSTPTPYPRLPNPTPTLTGSTLPESISLTDFIYVDQNERWNYCGPSSLAMALNFWGWQGNRDDIARIVKPGVQDPRLDFIQRGKWDKNVMLYELADYVQDQTEFNAIIRYGGEIDLIKRLIAAGFPVVIEKGYYERDYTGKMGWLGHYAFTTGYDEKAGVFTYQETYPPKGESGQDRTIQYDAFREGWRGFNYLFMIVFPPERETDVLNLLGPWNDLTWANQHAFEIANAEIQSLTGTENFFVWFNKGTSLVALQQYSDAAEAYDQAFWIYAKLDQNEKTRPYRIMWYQTGPYWAYYYSGRYQDVIELANTTLNETIANPTLEESLYWRGLAEYALGNTEDAIADLREAVRLNPNFVSGVTKLQEWAVSTK